MPLTSESAERKDRASARNTQLQHRHFAFIADVLREAKPEHHWDANKMAQWEVTVTRFVAAFQKSNSRFDSARFRTACNCDE